MRVQSGDGKMGFRHGPEPRDEKSQRITDAQLKRVPMPAPFRLAGLSRPLREAFPDAGTPVYEAVTWLGDPGFLTFGLALLYWIAVDRRRETTLVVSYGFVAFGGIVALKSGIALPRPPESVARITTDGYGFPSGHAVAAVVIYGGLALEYDWLADRSKLAATAVVVTAVAVSRVVLGVHYLGDILVGAVVGVVALIGARALANEDPRLGFGLGLGAAIPAVVVTGGGETALGILGACLGGILASLRFDLVPTSEPRIETVLLILVGLPLVVLARATESALSGIPVAPAVDDMLIVSSILLLPVVFARAKLADRLPVDAESG